MSLLVDNIAAAIIERLSLVKFNYKTPVNNVHYRPVQVYTDIPDRDKKSPIYPCYAVEYRTWEFRHQDKRPGHELFTLRHVMVTDVSNTSPMVVTTDINHRYEPWMLATISGVTGNTAANGTWVVRNTTDKTFELWCEDGAASTGSGEYEDGGEVQRTTELSWSLASGARGVRVTGVKDYTRRPYPNPVDFIFDIYTISTDIKETEWLDQMLLQCFPLGYQNRVDNMVASYLLHTKPANLDDRDMPMFRHMFILKVADLWVERLEHYTGGNITDPSLDWDAVSGGY